MTLLSRREIDLNAIWPERLRGWVFAQPPSLASASRCPHIASTAAVKHGSWVDGGGGVNVRNHCVNEVIRFGGFVSH